jgi:uridine kinase
MINHIEKFDSYSLVVRIRPDIDLSMTPIAFLDILSKYESCSENEIFIPKGYDLFDHKLLTHMNEKTLKLHECVNDQIALCKPSVLKIYASTFHNLFTTDLPIVSEHILYYTLVSNKIIIHRIDFPYTLLLSECQTIAISGDSASGKSHLLKILSSIFPFDQRILLETDRYHKYDRYDSAWSTITHLHPHANNLEKMADDLYCLKLGDDVFTVDYDHTSGKFTEPTLINSKPFVLLCGLHTLYSNSLRSLSDLKIFMDVEDSLKKYWKVYRDIVERNHTLSKVLQTIEHRKMDYSSFVLPQKDYANLVISYKPLKKLPDFSNINLDSFVFDKKEFPPLYDSDLHLTLTFDQELFEIIGSSVLPFVQTVVKRSITISTELGNIIEKNVIDVEIQHTISYDDVLKIIFTSIFYKE